MILIISEKFDIATENIISELSIRKANFKLICGEDFLENKFIFDINNEELFMNQHKLPTFNIALYRRWINANYKFSDNINENFYLRREFEELASNFIINLNVKKWINTPPFIRSYPTKALQLKIAKECNLKIPNTIITNNSFSTQKFLEEQKNNIISKNLSDVYTYIENEEIYGTYTTSVSEKDIKMQKEIFFPSLFQNNINKDIEIRIFYFMEKFYSYAIFSSNNSKTEIDYRLYDFNHPNRIMKYILPKNIKANIKRLMKKLNLDTGSIDLIKDLSGNYYFLEVNPQGQFGGMKEYGLDIEKNITEYLIQNDII
ncbi:hypothetical protein HZP23_00875 [Elizabethkingia anophelis]|uniref:hypothetical protein n=1 Tax=Elizabethkingia anophelis TaxID=1117645 RepID=UPI0009999247|nr:hypothetical protein [Elizabethkingia anophelis]MCT4296118.1 hypothetical protein [Elizabethkingia anophelis]MCT4299390.1 hypothetical protein [Elizabethkingia anophelis]MDV3568866.1 hypothetical protein [Elizabethkingia anophelis]MDV3970439.1 hypothetical protein [Elizabethkingia anophelis]OPC41026.1 hypothetical protein BAY02_07560 [Elizabethkingia anophelis]